MKDFSEAELMAYLENRMGPEDIPVLEDALRRNPRLRKELLTLANFESELPGALHEVCTQVSPAPESANSQTAPGRPKGRSFMWILWPLAAAASLMIALRLFSPQKPAAPGSASPAPALAQTQKATQHVHQAVAVQQPVAGYLVEVNGDVRVTEITAGSPAVLATSGSVVHVDATISLGTNATARFAFTDGSKLRLYQQSAIVLKQSETGSIIDMQKGALDGDIRPQSPGKKLVVRTKYLTTDIIGTQFRFMASSVSTWVGVREGRVRVIRAADGQQVELDADNYAAVAPNWPYMRMNARLCPMWKSVCQKAAGSPYP